jgi:hypothetical protein
MITLAPMVCLQCNPRLFPPVDRVSLVDLACSSSLTAPGTAKPLVWQHAFQFYFQFLHRLAELHSRTRSLLNARHRTSHSRSAPCALQEVGMRVLEVNLGSSQTGPQLLKLLGEATASHRVHWRSDAARGTMLNWVAQICEICSRIALTIVKVVMIRAYCATVAYVLETVIMRSFKSKAVCHTVCMQIDRLKRLHSGSVELQPPVMQHGLHASQSSAVSLVTQLAGPPAAHLLHRPGEHKVAHQNIRLLRRLVLPILLPKLLKSAR